MKSWRMGREASAFRFLVLPLVAILAVFVMAGCDGAAVGGNGQPEPAIETSPEAARTFVEKVVATGEESADGDEVTLAAVSYTHLRAHETPEHLVCRLLLEKKNKDEYSYRRRSALSISVNEHLPPLSYAT